MQNLKNLELDDCKIQTEIFYVYLLVITRNTTGYNRIGYITKQLITIQQDTLQHNRLLYDMMQLNMIITIGYSTTGNNTYNIYNTIHYTIQWDTIQ